MKIKNLSLNKIIEYGFYLFIFLLPWQTRWIWRYGELSGGRWEYGTFSLFGTEILLWLIFLLLIFVNFKKRRIFNFQFSIFNKFSISNIQYPIFLFFTYLFLSIFWSLDKSLAAYNILHLIEAGVLVYLIHSINSGQALEINFNFKKLFYIIFASSFVQACLGIWQFIDQRVVANKWLGMAQQWSSELGVSVVETVLRRWLRAYGSFSHPNILAGFLALGFLIGFYLIINHQVENKKQLYGKLVLIVCNLIILIGLLFTFSRGAWVSLALVVFIFLVFSYKELASWQKVNFWRTIIYGFIFSAVIIFVFSQPFLTRIKGDTRLEKKSTTERVSYYQEAWQLIKKRPLLGVGVGNYTLAVHDLIDSSRESWSYQPVHNVFVLVLVELGVVGFILFISLLVYLFIDSRKKLLLVTSYCLLITIMLFDHYLWTSYFGVMLLGLVVGIFFKTKKAPARGAPTI